MDAAIGTLTTPPAARRSAGEGAFRVKASSGSTGAAERKPQAAAFGIETEAERNLSSRREVDQDEATGSLIYRVVDLATGAVTTQTPSEARLKLRAYIDNVVSRQTAKASFDETA